MKLHEYQARGLLDQCGVPVPPSTLAYTPAEARAAAASYGRPVVVKAQVLVGGRGKAGGVRRAATPGEAERVASAILGLDIRGERVEKVLVTPAADIADELYLGAIVDRATRRVVMMASAAGGVDIEEVAAKTPELIVRVAADPLLGLLDYQARELAFGLGLRSEQVRAFVPFVSGLYRALAQWDASLAEINPLAILADGSMAALDAKIVVDDNAAFRHPEYATLRNPEEEAPAERAAREQGLNFVKLDGSIGCVVNGAGLAMATMDLVKLFGAAPANFLDMGGGARADRVAAGLRIILLDEAVKVILFNIFGGITRCDEVARGIVAALPTLPRPVPIVVRLVGTNQQEGRRILEQANLISAEAPEEAAQAAVEASRR
ncbi:MAG: ADP-forming succinate--CoA ligase subunit beta [Chloroflexi bacterium]|nr:ADP-forming succinate--CoA ligase subunit beta [Chloroflexota bacterium]